MTTAAVTTPRIRTQWPAIARPIAAGLVAHIAITFGVLVVILAGYVLGRLSGGSFSLNLPDFSYTFPGDDAALLGSPAWLLLALGVTIASVVMVVVAAATRTPSLLGAGATRRDVGLAILAQLPVVLLCLGLVYAITYALMGRQTVARLITPIGLEPGQLIVGAALGIVAAVLTGLVILTLFQRWPWWVGAVVLVVAGVVPPLLILLDLSFLAPSPLWDVLRVVLLGALYWLMLRRLPVP